MEALARLIFPDCLSDCSRQDEQFSLVFTTASFMNNFMTLLSGFLFDRFGTMVTRFCAVWVQHLLWTQNLLRRPGLMTEATPKKQSFVARMIKNCCNKCITKTSKRTWVHAPKVHIYRFLTSVEGRKLVGLWDMWCLSPSFWRWAVRPLFPPWTHL